MGQMDNFPAWQALKQHRLEYGDTPVPTLFSQDPQRFKPFSLQAFNLKRSASR